MTSSGVLLTPKTSKCGFGMDPPRVSKLWTRPSATYQRSIFAASQDEFFNDVNFSSLGMPNLTVAQLLPMQPGPDKMIYTPLGEAPDTKSVMRGPQQGCLLHMLFGAEQAVIPLVQQRLQHQAFQIGMQIRVGDGAGLKLVQGSWDRRPIISNPEWGLQTEEGIGREAAACCAMLCQLHGLDLCGCMVESDSEEVTETAANYSRFYSGIHAPLQPAAQHSALSGYGYISSVASWLALGLPSIYVGTTSHYSMFVAAISHQLRSNVTVVKLEHQLQLRARMSADQKNVSFQLCSTVAPGTFHALPWTW